MKIKTTPRFALLFVFLFANLFLNAQNPYWTLPPNKWKVGIGTPQALPAPGGCPSNYWGACNYNADLSQYPSNVYADTAGNPLFFVVNGVVYNRNGYLIDGIATSHYSGGLLGTGWSEVCIVPDPASCTKYFIFSSMSESAVCTEGGSSPTYNQSPTCMHIDLAQPNPYYPNTEYGKNITGATSPNTAQDLYDWTVTKWPTGDSGQCSPFRGDIHYAVTKLISNSYRLLFINNGNEMVIYKIDGVGIGVHWLQSYDLGVINGSLIGSDGGSSILSEIELFENTTRNRVKVAYVAVGGGGGDWGLGFADFDLTTGVFKTGTGHSVCYNDGGGCCTYSGLQIVSKIGGIEFSPDGSKLFFTHTPNHCHNHAIDAVDTVGTTFTHYNPTNGNHFINSQVEYGKDGNMWFIGFDTTGSSGTNRRLAKISSPNTPGSFTDNVVTLSSYPVDPVPIGGAYSLYELAWYLPDQIDHETYGYQLYGSTTCCLTNSVYDKFTYKSGQGSGWSAASQMWTPTNNPLNNNGGNTVTIGRELRVAAGYSVTIKNMTIKFSPQATFVVEGKDVSNSINSGVLILKNCTLDCDNRCGINKMWPGVRVWGNNTLTRTGYTEQGYINLDSNCVIQNAWVAIELGYLQNEEYKYNMGVAPKPPVAADSARAGGGIINCNSTSFINNQRGIYFGDYGSTGGVSSVFKSTFSTTAYLLGGSANPVLSNIQLNNYVPNALIKGDNFTCSTSLTATGYAWGYHGVHSYNSNAVIDYYLIGGTFLNTFSHLDIGVYAHGTGNANTVSTQHSRFFDNWEAAEYSNIVNSTFSNNDSVKVRNTSCVFGCVANGPNFVGLYLDNCHGYKVDHNYFTAYSGTKNTFGVIANNSGNYVNCIWTNTFKSLYKGSQAQYRNFVGNSRYNWMGLFYLCNTFSTNSTADIYIPVPTSSANWGSGTDTAGVAFNHGYGNTGYPYTGGNTFSKTSGGHDFYIDNATTKIKAVNYIYHCTSAPSPCTGATNNPDNGSTANLTIAPWAGADSCSINPYTRGLRISDPIQAMLGYASDLKLTADSIVTELNSTSAGDTAQILYLTTRLSLARSTRHRVMDEVIHSLLDNKTDTTDAFIYSLMKEQAMELPVRSQLEVGVAIQDAAFASQALDQVRTEEGESNYVKVYSVLIQNLGKTPQAIMADPQNLALMQQIDRDSSDRKAFTVANMLLESIGLSNYRPIVQESTPSDSSVARKGSFTQSSFSSDFNARPNPFKNSCTISATIIEKDADASIVITDMLGKEVKHFPLTQGTNEVSFVATDANQQVLFCTLVINGIKVKVHKLVLIK